MEISEDFLKAHQRQTRRGERSDCPSSEELSALAEGELPADRRGAVLDHLVGCSDCALEVRMAREIGREVARGIEAFSPQEVAAEPALKSAQEEQSREADLGSVRDLRRASSSRAGMSAPRWMAAVAAVLIAAIGGLWLTQNARIEVPSPVERATPTSVSPFTGSRLKTAPNEISWPPEAGAEGYRLHLYDGGAKLLWQSPWLEQPTALLPVDVKEALPQGEILWTVEIRGQVIQQELGPFTFSLH